MRDYEALVICDAKLEEGDIQKAIDRFTAAITDREGEVVNIDRWGIRRFAYEINHQHEGYYFAVTFRASVESIAEIEHVVNIADEFIRGKITRGAPAAAAVPAAQGSTSN
ncbi:MAG: 30S ribosomal protein S6 [Actinomycetota bacterium]